MMDLEKSCQILPEECNIMEETSGLFHIHVAFLLFLMMLEQSGFVNK